MIRLAILSDLHCGHQVGLTPPKWQRKSESYYAMRRACWDFYASKLREHGPFQVVVVNGDCVDGKGERSGGTELLTSDMEEQCEIAERCIQQAMSPGTKLIMTYGTAYHVSPGGEDCEKRIAKDLKAVKIGSHEWIDAEGIIIDLKHHVGGSSIPHGRYTAMARDALWNQLWALRKQQPLANIIIRSHLHYHRHCGGHMHEVMTTPALQGYGSKWGTRRCSGDVEFGFIVIECHNKSFAWKPIIADLPVFRTHAMKV